MKEAAAALRNSVSVAGAFGGSDEEQAGNDEGAVREVAQVYELIKMHLPLLLHNHPQQQQQLAMANTLLSQALRALNVALSLIKHPQPPAAAALAAAHAHQLSSSSPANSTSTITATPGSADDGHNNHVGKARSRPAKRKRSIEDKSSSWVNLTAVPYEDGYLWRKYGEKKIQGTDFTRSYFRCTYRDDKGCQATKQIQQKDSNDPPMFQVTYTNEHTCNFCTTTTIINNNNNNSNNNPAAALHKYYLAGNSPNCPPDDDTICSKMIKQEPAQLAPTDLAATTNSNDQLDETTLYVCQEVPPSSKIYYNDSTVGTCSSNTTAMADCANDQFNYHEAGQLAETMVMEEALGLGLDPDDPYNDPHYLLLLYEYFNY